jgi:hypothetical protein
MLGSAAMSRRELPARPVRFLYVAWTVSSLALGAWGIATQTWQLAALGAARGVLTRSGFATWVRLMQRRVPSELLGRVTALDCSPRWGSCPCRSRSSRRWPRASGSARRCSAPASGAHWPLACLPLARRPPARAS